MGPDLLFLCGGVFVTILAGWAGLRAGASQRRAATMRRLGAITGCSLAGSGKAETQITLRRDDFAGHGVDGRLGRFLPRLKHLHVRLARTGRRMSVTAYMMISLALMIGVAGIGHSVVGLALSVSVLLAVALGLIVPHLTVGLLAKRRMAKFNTLFPDAIDLMVRGLRSGLPVTECVKIVGEELPDPVGVEFRRVTDAVRFGTKLSDALWQTAHRLDLAEFKFFVVSLSVQQETGGNLAETLANLSEILRRRKQMGLKIKAMSSEAKASAMILGALPFIMFCIIYVMNPDYESMLFTDPRGRIVLAGGLLTMAAGIFVMSRMVRFEI